jgi:folate-binding protein YgfZ
MPDMPASPAGAVVASVPSANRWPLVPADFAPLLAGPVCARLDDLGIVEVEGADALAFLQSQTTADIAALSPGSWQLGGYCTPKGRLLATFQAWRFLSGVRLLVPRDLLPALVRRLSQYVLRAKVRISDASARWAVLGICGTGSAQRLQQMGLEVPAQPWQCGGAAGQADSLPDAELRVARVPGGTACPERLLLLLPAERADAWRQRLAALALPQVPAGVWWWSQIDAAIPEVFAATQERFVPQSINLEVLGGVNFRKGCYPGQEIVARSQYLGKLRRRLALAHADRIGAGSDIYADGRPEPIGRIVMAAGAPQGGWDLLYECPSETAAGAPKGSLHAGSPDAPPLVARALPYAVFDPTA